MGISAPVLLIAFNRPDTTQIVFNHIREAKPEKLYLAVDGPRKNIKEEDLVNEVKNILTNIDWPCQIKHRYNKENLGAELTVSSAISWVLDLEECVIILEDDIVAPLAFFTFMQKMLERYKDNDKIGTVTGNNFTPIKLEFQSDYFFAKYGHSWGWGTWRRVWDEFDLNVEIPDEHLTKAFLETITNSKSELKHYHRLFKQIKKNGSGNSTWDTIGNYYHRINSRLSVIPRVNLTSNIGIHGLHARGQTEHHFRPYDENFSINTHPREIKCNKEYDKNHFKTYIQRKTPIYIRVVRKLARILKIQS